jgi:hypothetical protein
VSETLVTGERRKVPDYPIGTLLIPSEYMVRNGNSTVGLILEVRDDLWGWRYRVLLTPSNATKWLEEDTIRNLFDVVEP